MSLVCTTTKKKHGYLGSRDPVLLWQRVLGHGEMESATDAEEPVIVFPSREPGQGFFSNRILIGN
jgi:hypothetical protein